MTTNAADVLIIEDEPLISMDLEATVEGMGHQVIGVARTAAEAVEMAKQNPPKLILADIQLADGTSGLDAVNELMDGLQIPVIFITAYPERFFMGIQPPRAWLLAKPFQPEDVEKTINQALA